MRVDIVRLINSHIIIIIRLLIINELFVMFNWPIRKRKNITEYTIFNVFLATICTVK